LPGDFTIEMWVNITSLLSQTRFFNLGRSNNGGNGAYWYYSSSNSKLIFNVNGSGTLSGTTAMVANQWYHIAVTRSGSTGRQFINGVLDQTTTGFNTILVPDSVTGVLIGAENSVGTVTANYNGYIDDLRITKGIARYTSNFTPPTSAFQLY
jgi:hypothetical protein